jgi:hypothetical protein
MQLADHAEDSNYTVIMSQEHSMRFMLHNHDLKSRSHKPCNPDTAAGHWPWLQALRPKVPRGHHNMSNTNLSAMNTGRHHAF